MPFQIIRQVNFRGEVQTRTIDIPGTRLRIGRGTSNDLQLEDLGVSQYQAEVFCNAQGQYAIKDATESGQLFLNNKPIIGENFLQAGDRVGIYGYELIVDLSDPTSNLVLTLEKEPKGQSEPALALMPKLQLSAGRWTRKSLSFWLTLFVLVGSFGAFALGKPGMFMPGPVSLKHVKFTEQCEKCHSEWKAVWNLVPDKTCQGCHPKTILSPSHFEKRSLTPSPRCASCHLEHKEELSLVAVPDYQCVQCHENLKVKDSTFPVETKVHHFTNGHPEFAITRHNEENNTYTRVRLTDKAQLKDDARLKLNHKCHLAPDLLGDKGPETLTCESCHRVDQKGQYMLPTNYERDCKRCHLLTFDTKRPERTITHGGTFTEVRQELNEIYAEFYLFPPLPGEKKRARGVRRLPGQPPTREEQLYVRERVDRAEQFLLPPKGKVCLKCHSVETDLSGKKQLLALPLLHDDCGSASKTTKEIKSGHGKNLDIFMKGAVPSSRNFEITKMRVPERWLPYSRFDHTAHFGLPEIKSKDGHLCLGCHQHANQSRETADVMLAGISHCRTCHMEPGGAQAECKTCHDFHPKNISEGLPRQANVRLVNHMKVSHLTYHPVRH